MEALGWDRRCLLLTNHALVLAVIADEPTVRIREIAERVEITERAVESLLADLISVGFLSRKRVGRRNAYEIHGASRLRHPLVGERTVSGLLRAIAPGRGAAKPETAFVDPEPGSASPEETLSCGNGRSATMLRAATSSTKEGVTMKRVLVYMVVASLLAFATAALAATTGGHHKLRHPAAGIQGSADSNATNAAGVASGSAGVTGRTAKKVGPAEVSTTAKSKASARQNESKGSAGGAVSNPPASAGGSAGTTVGVGSHGTSVSVGAGNGGVNVGVSPPGGNPISVGVSPPGSGQPPITVGGDDPLSGLGL
jgi:hypothetical protein